MASLATIVLMISGCYGGDYGCYSTIYSDYSPAVFGSSMPIYETPMTTGQGAYSSPSVRGTRHAGPRNSSDCRTCRSQARRDHGTHAAPANSCAAAAAPSPPAAGSAGAGPSDLGSSRGQAQDLT